jgi:hypothetical protein
MIKFRSISLILFLTSFLTLSLLSQLLSQQAANSQEENFESQSSPIERDDAKVLFCNKTSQTIDTEIKNQEDATWNQKTLNPGRCRSIILRLESRNSGTLYFFANGNRITRNVGGGSSCYDYNGSGLISSPCPHNF